MEKKAQKNEMKKNTSEIINKIIPDRSPLVKHVECYKNYVIIG
jgi:hypothetical protein